MAIQSRVFAHAIGNSNLYQDTGRHWTMLVIKGQKGTSEDGVTFMDVNSARYSFRQILTSILFGNGHEGSCRSGRLWPCQRKVCGCTLSVVSARRPGSWVGGDRRRRRYPGVVAFV